MKKNFILNIHAFAGLFAGIFILLMSVSGAILVFHDNLDARHYPTFNPVNKPVTVNTGYREVQLQYPNSRISNAVLPGDAAEPVTFYIYDQTFQNGTAGLQLFVHPQTGTILQSRDGNHDFISKVSALHRTLYLGKTGEWLLGFFAAIFLLSLITGVILFRKNIAAVLFFKKEVFTKGNLHQVIGVYALAFNLMMAITGFWMQRYVFKKAFYSETNYTRVFKSSPPLAYHFDTALQQVKQQYPDFTPRVIYFPASTAGKAALYGSQASNAYIHSKKFADVIFLDSTGQIASTRFIKDIDAADRYDIVNSQLHMGKFGGWVIKLVYFVFGLTGALLSITGFLIWYRKRVSFSKQQ